MQHLETERLKFRLWQESDFKEIERYFKEEQYARYLGGVKDSESSWRLMATYLGHYQLMGFSYLAIETKSDHQLIGTVGLWNSTPWPEPELGYWLLPIAMGKGYGVEAGLAVKEYAKEIELPSLVSYIDPVNEPSKKLALRLGAKLDGVVQLLDFGKHEVYRYW